MSDVTSLPVEFLCHVEYTTGAAPIVISGGPAGTRIIVSATSGTFEGPRLRGEVIGPGGDWVTAAPNGTLRLDVRALWRTDDGADILVTYTGIGVAGADGLAIRAAPRFEVGESRYSWLNNVQAVGIGRMQEPGIVYDLYSLT